MKKVIGGTVVVILILVAGYLFMSNKQTTTTPTPAPEAAKNEPVVNNADVTPIANTSTDSAVVIPLKEFVVEGMNFSFKPNELKVNKNDIVKITFKNTQGFHDFVIKDYQVSTKQKQSPSEETIQFIADKTGTFEIICSVGKHKEMGMIGKLIVQ